MGVVLKCVLEPGCSHALWQQFSIKGSGWKVLMVMCYSLCNLIERYWNATSWQLRLDINQKCRYLMTWRWGPTRKLYFSGFTVLTFHSFFKLPKETKNWGRDKNRWNPHTAFNTVHLIQIPLLRFFFYFIDGQWQILFLPYDFHKLRSKCNSIFQFVFLYLNYLGAKSNSP